MPEFAFLDDVPADSRAIWRALGHGGELTALYPDGRIDTRRLRALLTALDARYPMGPVLSVCVQVATALPVLRAGGGDTIEKVYRSALDGESVLALAATDTGAAGSDLTSLSTTAELSDDHVVVKGGKRWITNATTADHALVLARHRPQRHFTSFVWVLVPSSAPGVRSEPAGSQLYAGAGLGHLEFDGVVLGRDHVVGSPGRGLALFVKNVTTERLAGAYWASALCRRVLRETHQRLIRRPLGDGTLWDNAAIRERFARCLVESRRIDALCVYSETDPVSGMLLKAAVAEGLDTVLSECARLSGADAFADGGLARLRAEASMFGIAGGASGAMLGGIADHAPGLLGARS